MTVSYFLKKSLLRLTVSFVFILLQLKCSEQTQLDTKRVVFFKEIPILFDLRKDTSISRFTPTKIDIDHVDTLLSKYFSE